MSSLFGLAEELAATFVVDPKDVFEALRVYTEALDGKVNWSDLAVEHETALRQRFGDAYARGDFVRDDDLLAQLRSARDDLDKLREQVRLAERYQADIVRRALARKKRVKDIVEATGLSRARIYQIKAEAPVDD